MITSRRALILAIGTSLGTSTSLMLFAGPVMAQVAPEAASRTIEEVEEILVTGSRIRRAETESPAPVTMVDLQQIADRGYVAAGQALNAVTSITPAIPQSLGNAQTLGSGATYPNLFNLGAGRTLTLLNGQRMVTTASGLGDRVVDTNIVPIGLLERVDVVQAGGAAVYGSDAIAGVVNYVLRKDFEGIEVDAQSGISSRGDYPQHSVRLTAGRNFNESRGNVAINLEWSKADSLASADRPETNPYSITAANPADTGPSDGIPSVARLSDARFYAFNPNGVIFTIPAPVALPPCGNQICFLRSGGVPQQFSADGQSIMAFDPGAIFNTPFSQGGQGTSFGDLASLYVGVERYNANLIGRYEITDHVSVSTSILGSRVVSTDPLGAGQGGVTNTVLNSPASGSGPIAFTRNNPFLTAGQLTALGAASPAFAAGAPLFLSKQFTDLLPTNASEITTDTYRAAITLEGDFAIGARDFYYTVYASHAEVDSETEQYGIHRSRFTNAISAARNASGKIVCSINATTVVDPACAPINPFGIGNISAAARNYVGIPAGTGYENRQDDYLINIGGDVIELPGGTVKFSLGYEHREESAEFNPSEARRLGLVGQNAVIPTAGQYHTNEFAGELLVPVLGGDFSAPLLQAVELSGQFRRVENSVAGTEDVWGLGLRWEVVDDVALRGSLSRNFRAPTLDQLFAPSVTQLGGVLVDPCDARFIDSGPSPATRRANCEALFAANPSYNGGRGLDGYIDPNTNTAGALITTQGNSELENEVSDTTTYGVVLRPRVIPGLTITADRLEVDLLNGLTAFQPQHFTQSCFDSIPQPLAACSTFTRDSNGDIVSALNTTLNVAEVKYRGETYNVNYDFNPNSTWGAWNLGLEATHNTQLTTRLAGTTTQAAGTTLAPHWVMRLNAAWTQGPLRLSYEAFYLSDTKVNSYDTIETTPTPNIPDNLRHSVGGSYDFGTIQVRAGVNNVTDERPSYPTLTYGDIIGRFYYLALRASY